MPYVRRRGSRRYRGKRSTYTRYRKKKYYNRRGRSYGYRNIMKSAERKYTDIVSSVNVSSTATLTLLNGLFVGDTSTSRDGQTVRFVSLVADFYTEMSNAAFASNVRILIFMDRQANAAAPAVLDVLLTSSANAMMNLDNMYRFKVIKDYKFCLSSTGACCNRRRMFIPLSFNTRYDVSSNGDITDIRTGSLYVLFVSDEPTNTPMCFYSIRLRYYDI